MEQADGHWEARVRHRTEKRADELVAPLLAKGLQRDEVEKAVRGLKGLDPKVRALALELERSRSRPKALNDAAWLVARESDHDPATYALALRRAEASCDDQPDFPDHLHTLGVTQYRVGLYREALATLTRTNTLFGGREPDCLAFMALSQQKLGQQEAARQTLAQFRDAVKATGYRTEPGEVVDFLREAEAVIELDPAFPADPFAP
jgi:hypothetical protein